MNDYEKLKKVLDEIGIPYKAVKPECTTGPVWIEFENEDKDEAVEFYFNERGDFMSIN